MIIWEKIVVAIKAKSSFRRAEFFVQRIAPFLKPGDSLLDLGCGPGHIAVVLAKKYRQKVTMVDVIPCWKYVGQWLLNIPCARELSRQTGIPYRQYDGSNLPFTDNFFDTVLVAFVLHHASDPETVIKEAARVSRRRVIVLEDIIDPKAAIVGRIADSIVNLEFGGVHANRSQQEWINIFSSHGLKLINTRSWDSRLAGFHFSHVMFILER